MLVYLNGKFVAMADAVVSVQDRGFRFGDGLFETVGVYSGRPYLMDRHLERLSAGMEALRIPAVDYDSLPTAAMSLIQKNGLKDGILRIQVTRGKGSRGYMPKDANSPTLVMETSELPAATQEPIRCWMSSWERISPKALPLAHKLTQGLNSTLALMEAEEKGFPNAIMVNAAGEIAEAANANLFFVKHGILHTPSLECGGLKGVIRQRLMELSTMAVREGRYTLDDMRLADAVFLTNSRSLVIPVIELQPHGHAWFSEAQGQHFLDLLKEDIARN